MGYADNMRFEPADLALLAETEEVELETARPGGPPHRTIIWVVVDGDDAFIRSVLARKYADDPDLASMLEPEIFDTTLRLVPA